MHARYYAPHLARFLTIDPARESQELEIPQSWNRYAYVRGNGLKFVDPDGEVLETAWDVANVAVGVASLVNNVQEGNVGGALLDTGGLILDGLAAATPFVPGGAGATIKVARGAEKAADAAGLAKKVGQSGESASKAVRQLAGELDPNKLHHIFGQV